MSGMERARRPRPAGGPLVPAARPGAAPSPRVSPRAREGGGGAAAAATFRAGLVGGGGAPGGSPAPGERREGAAPRAAAGPGGQRAPRRVPGAPYGAGEARPGLYPSPGARRLPPSTTPAPGDPGERGGEGGSRRAPGRSKWAGSGRRVGRPVPEAGVRGWICGCLGPWGRLSGLWGLGWRGAQGLPEFCGWGRARVVQVLDMSAAEPREGLPWRRLGSAPPVQPGLAGHRGTPVLPPGPGEEGSFIEWAWSGRFLEG